MKRDATVTNINKIAETGSPAEVGAQTAVPSTASSAAVNLRAARGGDGLASPESGVRRPARHFSKRSKLAEIG